MRTLRLLLLLVMVFATLACELPKAPFGRPCSDDTGCDDGYLCLEQSRCVPRMTMDPVREPLSVGLYFACRLDDDDAITCWGEIASPPAGSFSSVSAGWLHACGLREDGRVACWGDNQQGQASAPEGTFVAVTAGGSHSCAVRTDGTVLCWGSNNDGQVTPTQPTFGLTQVSAGQQHTCALGTNGAISCWGFEGNGQLRAPGGVFSSLSSGGHGGCALREDGSAECWGTNLESGPPPSGAFVQVSAGYDYACGVRTDGTVACWGSDTTDGRASPPSGTFSWVSASAETTCGLTTDGMHVCWGMGFGGGGCNDPRECEQKCEEGSCFPGVQCSDTEGSIQCGACPAPLVGNGVSCACPSGTSLSGDECVEIDGCAGDPCFEGVTCTDVAAPSTGFDCGECPATFAGDGVSCTCPSGTALSGEECIDVDGCADDPCAPEAGCTDVAAPGTGHTCGACPTPMLGDGTVCFEVLGLEDSCALLSTGRVRCWRWSSFGGGAAVGVVEDVVAMGIGGHSCVASSSGAARCAGYNGQGQLGDGTYEDSHSETVTVSGLTGTAAGGDGVSSIAASGYHTCAVLESGGVRCWGDNVHGQLGDDSVTDRREPVDVVGLSDVQQVALGAWHSCALSNGAVFCWGLGFSGRLGAGTGINNSRVPVAVLGLDDATVVEISLGGEHSCARLDDGEVRCWGGNGYGQLGDGSIDASWVPLTVTGLGGEDTATSLSAGSQHTCVALGSGEARCWGRNYSNQLGDGTLDDSSVPVPVAQLSDVDQVSAGDLHSCARVTSGDVYCWGDNQAGQLGDGTQTNSPTPVRVVWPFEDSGDDPGGPGG